MIHINDAIKSALNEIERAKNGEKHFLKTGFERHDSYCLGGLTHNTIMSIAALSSNGKSTFAKCIRHNLSILNPEIKVKQLIFNFEMLASRQIIREIVTSTGIKMKKLLSVDSALSDEELTEVKSSMNQLNDKQIYFIETPKNPEGIYNVLNDFWLNECDEGEALVYELDHLLLVKGKEDKGKIDETMYALVQLKKEIASKGGAVIGLCLSQLNRSLKDQERILRNELHRPMTSDLMSSSVIEQCSDIITAVHIPAKLGIRSYTSECFPTIP
jgi:replicative DNA helicase